MKKLFTSVAKKESTILRDWSDNQSQGYFTGVVLDVCEVFSICDGVIVQVEKSIEYFQVITVQYSVDLYVRYLNIVDMAIDIVEGRTIQIGQKIGVAYHNNIHLEVCVPNAKSKLWPVRVGMKTLYKVDPMPYLEDSSKFNNYSTFHEVSENEASSLPDVELTEAMANEFDGMNRGEW